MIVNIEFKDNSANTLHIDAEDYIWDDKFLSVHTKDSIHLFSLDGLLHVFIEASKQ